MVAPHLSRSGAQARLAIGAMRKLVVWLALLLLSPVSWSQCVCGFQDGRPTLISITVDGAMDDWAQVHGDPDNNVCDGPANGIPDRDAPVQSTGRDLGHFAFTWDSASLYLFTERSGSANNVQRFVYYADTDNDGLMETGEPVVGANWSGSNREVSLYLFNYQSANLGGDPMVNGAGFADGYTLPGTFINVPQQNSPGRTGTWGSADGRQLEFAVGWSELGVAPGAAIGFHVASANVYFSSSSFTNQIDDNLAGCGGGPGVTRLPMVDLLVLKSVSTLSDPINLGVNPKAIPGAVMLCSIVVTNQGTRSADADTVAVTDALPSQTALFVADVDSPGGGPLLFSDGTPSSNLSYTFTGLSSGGDDLEFSNDGGASFVYSPVADPAGFDPAVTHIRVRTTGSMAAASAAGSPSFQLRYRLRVD